ncbi:unnamed protein product [Psylliodes chrysocephalus]|uniref:Uncharacterized protein n=1 Tax=Psylliodes chrysocephalus TaxID=3402493 RepID=A0A9P0GGV2_9CUCU|nr:unnamed protein product [Psylliodes chrysocephala]
MSYDNADPPKNNQKNDETSENEDSNMDVNHINDIINKTSDELTEINIFISESKFEDIKKRNSFKRKCLKLMGMLSTMDKKEFESEVKTLYKCCLRGVKDLHELHLRRKIGIQIIENLVERANPDYLTIQHVIHIIWSMISCIHHFQLRLKTESSGIIAWSRKREAEYCMSVYFKLLTLIKEPHQRVALNSILTFYKEGKLWEIEFGCTDMIVGLFELRPASDSIDDIIFTIEYSTITSTQEAKYLTELLYNIVRKIKWKNIPQYILEKFLNMMESSISPKPQEIYNYSSLRLGLENCIRNIINNLNSHDLIILIYLTINKINEYDEDEDMIFTLGKLCIHAAYKYKTNTKNAALARGPLPIVFKLFFSQNPIKTIIALKIWHHLVDRNDNIKHFLTPKIFFQECDFKLIIKKCHNRDKAFFKRVKQIVYEIIMGSFLTCDDKTGLENTFACVAITLVDIPCGYTASCFVTVAMSLQEYALRLTPVNRLRSHHLHATVLSILTLICYIYKAQVFYTYVLTVMEKRAEWAPHLNPPLKTHYEYAQHHILWNRPDLFFEDWEARYGLWKCFRGRKKLS